MSKILFLHNKNISYRKNLFKNLKEINGANLTLCFFDEVNILESLKKILTNKIIIISGSHSYKIILFFVISKILNKKIIFWTETWLWKNFDIKNKIYLTVISFIAKRSYVLVYPGKKVKDFYYSLGLKNKKQFFAPNSSIKNLKISDNFNRYNFGYYARIIPRKGLDLLIMAFKELPPRYKLYISGKIENKDFYKKCLIISENSKNIIFTKEIQSLNEQNKFFNFFSTLIYPSIDNYGMGEPWGLALNEAIEANKMVISTKSVAAAYDLIKNGKNGFIIEKPSKNELIKTIKLIKKLDSTTVKETNRKLLKKYSYKNMAKGFQEAIESCL